MKKGIKNIIEQDLDIRDIKILDKIANPTFFDDFENVIAKKISEKSDMAIEEIIQRIQKLKEKKIIFGFAGLIDPMKIWDNVIFTFVKLSLSPPLIEKELLKKYPSGWKEIGEFLNSHFVKKNRHAKEILRGAWTLIGTEWDLLVISTTNDLKKHREMFEELVNLGFIEMARSVFPIEGAPYVYRPYLMPSIKEIEESKKELKRWIEEQE